MLIGYMFLAIVINTLEAIRNVPQVSIHYALTMGASRGQVFRTIVLPAIVPELVGGIRVGVALALGDRRGDRAPRAHRSASARCSR